jgi:hypothetical protein
VVCPGLSGDIEARSDDEPDGPGLNAGTVKPNGPSARNDERRFS